MGMNQSGFATAMRVSAAVVSGWKKRTGIPREHFGRAAEVLKCSVDELLGLPSPRAPPDDWPFSADVSSSMIHSLSLADRKRVEAAILDTVTELESARREKNVRQLGRSKPDAQPHRNRKNPSQ